MSPQEIRLTTTSTLLDGLEIIEFLSKQPEPAGMREILDATAMTRATAFRVINQLVEAGWICAEGSPRVFSVGRRTASIGLRSLRRDPARHAVVPSLIGLATEARLPAFFSCVEGGRTWWLDVVEVINGRVVHDPVGQDAPALATATGRAILSDADDDVIDALIAQAERVTPATRVEASQLRSALLDARARGYAVVHDEYRMGLTSMAAPIRNASVSAIAAIGLSEIDSADEERAARLPEALLRWARRASIECGYRTEWGLG
jgi:DNA-binding IclR family transcriptional regulator